MTIRYIRMCTGMTAVALRRGRARSNGRKQDHVGTVIERRGKDLLFA